MFFSLSSAVSAVPAGSPVRINEVAPSSSPDWVEFYVASGGNYSNYIFREGSTVIQGSTWTNTAAGKTFPDSFSPATGDYIILHFNDDGVTASEDSSSGKGVNGIWDLYTTDSGLTATDNMLTLRNASDTAPMIDAMAYSDKNGTGSPNMGLS